MNQQVSPDKVRTGCPIYDRPYNWKPERLVQGPDCPQTRVLAHMPIHQAMYHQDVVRQKEAQEQAMQASMMTRCSSAPSMDQDPVGLSAQQALYSLWNRDGNGKIGEAARVPIRGAPLVRTPSSSSRKKPVNKILGDPVSFEELTRREDNVISLLMAGTGSTWGKAQMKQSRLASENRSLSRHSDEVRGQTLQAGMTLISEGKVGSQAISATRESFKQVHLASLRSPICARPRTSSGLYETNYSQQFSPPESGALAAVTAKDTKGFERMNTITVWGAFPSFHTGKNSWGQ